VPAARVPLASPDPLLPASLLAFRECSSLCSTITISFAADITNLFDGPRVSWPAYMHKSHLTSSRFSNNTATRSPARGQTGEGSPAQVRAAPECPQ
jgi:hypothetical protein